MFATLKFNQVYQPKKPNMHCDQFIVCVENKNLKHTHGSHMKSLFNNFYNYLFLIITYTFTTTV